MERLNTIKGIHVMKRADMQKFLQEHPNALNRVQQAIAVQKEMQEIKAKAIADGTFMKAPNGKPTKLNERQWLQVRTKNFINWFGDWINDPANASKVVDENGEPLIVWHGSKTSNEITIFHDGPTYFSDRFTASSYTPSSFVAKDETDYMYPCFLNIKSPKLINGNGSYWNNVNGMSTDDIVKSIDKNEDGVIIKDIKDYSEFAQGNPDLSLDLLEEAPLHTDYVTTSPNQIKSATDNNGMFSTENDDIQMAIDRFVDKYSLPKGELPALSSALSSKFGNKTAYGDVIHTANYEYTVIYRGVEDFDIIEYHQIDNSKYEKINNKESRGVRGSLNRVSSGNETTKRKYSSDNYNASDREATRNHAGLDKEASQRESQQTQGNVSGKEHQGRSTRLVKTGADGTTFPRVIEF